MFEHEIFSLQCMKRNNLCNKPELLLSIFVTQRLGNYVLIAKGRKKRRTNKKNIAKS